MNDEAPTYVELVSLLSRDVNGSPCITSETLDDIWPRDDRDPVLVIGKGVNLPPTCTGEWTPCFERFDQNYCLEAVFSAPALPLSSAEVPVPGAAGLLISALLLVGLWRTFK